MATGKPLRFWANEPSLSFANLGACVVSARITEEGATVGFMVRNATDLPGDSGWTFLAGDESAEYLANHENFSFQQVTAIAERNSVIVPYLCALPGQSFDLRDSSTAEAQCSAEYRDELQQPPSRQEVSEPELGELYVSSDSWMS